MILAYYKIFSAIPISKKGPRKKQYWKPIDIDIWVESYWWIDTRIKPVAYKVYVKKFAPLKITLDTPLYLVLVSSFRIERYTYEENTFGRCSNKTVYF